MSSIPFVFHLPFDSHTAQCVPVPNPDRNQETPAERLQLCLPAFGMARPFLFSSFKLKSEGEIGAYSVALASSWTIIPDKSDTPPGPSPPVPGEEVDGRVCRPPGSGENSAHRAVAGPSPRPAAVRRNSSANPWPRCNPDGKDPVPPPQPSEAQEPINAMTEQRPPGGRDGAAPGLQQR